MARELYRSVLRLLSWNISVRVRQPGGGFSIWHNFSPSGQEKPKLGNSRRASVPAPVLRRRALKLCLESCHSRGRLVEFGFGLLGYQAELCHGTLFRAARFRIASSSSSSILLA